jgi:hypothetical protein
MIFQCRETLVYVPGLPLSGSSIRSAPLGGDATPAGVSHAVAIRRSSGEPQFEQTDDPYQWVLPTGNLELVHVEGSPVAPIFFCLRRGATRREEGRRCPKVPLIGWRRPILLLQPGLNL